MPEHPNAAETSVQSIPVPPSPQAVKSSNEILCELFGAFNAKPPPLDDITPQDSQGNTSEKSHKKHKKHSSKKKHKKVKKKRRSSSSDTRSSVESKRKTKKHKKDSSKSGSESVISSKKNKRKLGKFSASDSDSDEEELKSKKKKSCKEESLKGSSRKKYDNVHIKKEKEEPKTKSKDFEPISIQESILKHAVGRIVDKVIDSTNLTSGLCESAIGRTFENSDLPNSQNLFKPIKEEPQSSENQQNLSGNSCNLKPKCESEQLPKNGDCDDRLSKSVDNLEVLNCIENTDLVSKHMPVADVFTEDLIECGVKKDDFSNKAGKPKVASGKITIQNLKFSQVFEATVKQIEEEAKLKAEKYEEGELSESSEEREKSLTPSEISSSGSVEEIKVSVKKEKSHRHKHRRERHHHSGDGDRTRSESREKHRSHSHRERSRSRHRHRERHSRESKKEQSSDIVSEKPKERSKDRNKERSPDRTRERSKRSRSKDKVKERTKERPRSRERSEKHRHGRSTSRDKVKRCSEDKIDKQKLLEIARKNALSMMKNPSGVLEQTKVAITSGGKTVNELTDFCKLLSKKDADGHESISSNTSNTSDSESEKPFHHPFQLKDRPSGIVLNIRNSVALPVKSLQEKTAEQSRQLRLQFPVSSGQHHRKTESQWIPVSPKKTEATTPTSNTQVAVVKPTTKAARVFKDTPEPPDMDISSIVSQRLLAMRRLQENPTDADALTQMYAAQQNMQSWAESKQQPPGQFTGSTGVKVLSQAELSSGFQAWARRDQLQMAAPVTSGMGMALLQKMGWRPGEGLGKNKEGTLQPLLLEVKMDKKGLVAQEELPVRQPHQVLRGPAKISLEGKHPVSLLNEYCCRRKFGPPYFELVDEAGPDHKKNFLFKVRVNGVEYKPAVGSPKKKQARAEAAEVCLKALGIFYNK